MRKIGIPCIPQFFYIKVGFKGVYIARTCFPDGSSVFQMRLLTKVQSQNDLTIEVECVT